MPNPKTGITMDVTKAVEEIEAGKATFTVLTKLVTSTFQSVKFHSQMTKLVVENQNNSRNIITYQTCYKVARSIRT